MKLKKEMKLLFHDFTSHHSKEGVQLCNAVAQLRGKKGAVAIG